MSKFLKQHSWKTTIAGVITFLMIALDAVQLMIDSNPDTNPDWNLVVAGFMTMVGLFVARDNNKRSEDVMATKWKRFN